MPMIKKMHEYIDREKTLRYLNGRTGKFIDDVGKGWNAGMEAAIGAIKKIPSEDVKPVVHGKWKDVYQDGVCHWSARCSKCGVRNDIPPVYMANYCPNCGARMDGETS